MAIEPWQRVEELFGQAAELVPDERGSFLDRACDGLPELRREVESLLEHDGRADEGFLRPRPPDPRLTALVEGDAPDSLIGRTLGAYTIRRLLARGGMGSVYVAEQDHPRREVALKIMNAGLASRSAHRRFEFESEVLARLQHPGIAQVYHAGTSRIDGESDRVVPYFVMEFLPDAKPINEYADTGRLGIADRLQLFAQVCDAVHHGHQRGVIHRDLKPANILVDATGSARVIDFGVARAVDSDMALTTIRTDVGQLMGTLAYMSPEQCDGDPLGIDIRTDLYSLGVVLYELLCGRLPYEVSRTSLYEAVRAVHESTPQSPGSVDRKLRGDLEAIVLKCLEKDRTRRYQSAAALADDVKAFLASEPIAARKPTRWVRAARWTGRHPVVTTIAACSVLAAGTLGGIQASVWLWHREPYEVRLSNDRSAVTLLAPLELHCMRGP